MNGAWLLALLATIAAKETTADDESSAPAASIAPTTDDDSSAPAAPIAPTTDADSSAPAAPITPAAEADRDETTADSSQDSEKPAKVPDPRRLEFGALPALSYSSDSGLGVGALVGLVKFAPGRYPYAWRIETLVSANIRIDQAGHVDTPFHQDYVSFDLPRLWRGRLRFSGRVAFERESDAAYFGVGNASVRDPARLSENSRAYQYDHIGPSLRLAARLRLAQLKASRLEAFAAPMLDWNWVQPYQDSALADDLGDAQLGVVGGGEHGLLVAATGLLWDGRNHESAPTRGFFSQVTLRAGAGLGESFAFGGLTLEQRAFVPLWEPYLVLAGRFMADFIVGDAPIYELSRGGGLTPIPMGGGARSVRGLFKERYAGPIKLLGNLELRSVFWAFSVVKQRMRLGAVGFLDAARVFSEYQYGAGLDGAGVGIKLGTGGGLRLHWGEHFIVRFDVAYSPTDGTRGLYIGVHHNF